MAYRDYDSGRYSSEPTSALTIYSPERVNRMGESGKRQILKDMDETVKFFKKVGGMSEKAINSMRVADVKDQKEKVAQKMTIGRMRSWIEDDIVPEPVVTKFGRFIKDIITFPFTLDWRHMSVNETTLSTIMGVIVLGTIGLLVWRIYG